jgi:hypothetical protein
MAGHRWKSNWRLENGERHMQTTQEDITAKRQQRWCEEIVQAENELRERRELAEQSRKQRIADAIGRHTAKAGGLSDERANKILDILQSATDDPPEFSRSAERGLDRMMATERNGGVAPFDWNEGERPATADEHVEMAIYAKFLAGQEPSGSEQAKFYQQLASKLAGGKGATVPDVPDVREQHPPGPDVPEEDWSAFRGRAAELWRERLEKARG